MRWNQASRCLGAASLAFIGVSGYTPFWNLVAGGFMVPAVRGESADAIVVLSGSLLEDHTLSHESWRRMLHGVRLHQQGLAALIVLSGGTADDRPTEAELRATIAREMGLSAREILVEETANTTREEAIRIGAILREHRAKRILLVTESLHMRRAALVFEREGFQVIPAPSDARWRSVNGLSSRLRLMIRVTQESAALLFYWSAGYI